MLETTVWPEVLDDAIQAALQRLASSEISKRCFVVVQDMRTKKFVQFCLTEAGKILLDLPLTQVETGEYLTAALSFLRPNPDMTVLHKLAANPDEATALTRRVLREVLAYDEQSSVCIEEDETGTPRLSKFS